MENWNDDRLDEFSQRVDESFKETREEMRGGFKEMREGFARVDREMREGFASVDHRFERVHDRLDKLFYLQLAFMGSLALALLTDKI